MNDTNNGSTDPQQWYHYYQQSNTTANPASGGTGFRFSETDSTIVTTSFTANNTSSANNSTSLGSTDVQLNPQPPSGKPIRRRSRASRRTPTTLLNASTTNFRSLVQQFTGCHNTKASSFGSQKGPVNLSFGNQNDHQIIGTSSRIAPLGSEYVYNQQMNPVVQIHQGQQWHQQQQPQEMYENSLVTNNNNMQSGGFNDFAIDQVQDLHELMDESSSFSTGDNNRDDLSFSTTESCLEKEFSNFGEIAEVNIVKDEVRKRSKGYAFIQYSSQEAALQALENMDQKYVDGRLIYVELAKLDKRSYYRSPITSGPPKEQMMVTRDEEESE